MDRRSRAERFRDARLAKGYKLQDVYDLCRVDKSFISRIENDVDEKFDPSVSNVCKLAKLYGKTVEQLMYGEENEAAIELRQGSETCVKTIKLGSLSERAITNVAKLSQLPYRRMLNELLSSDTLYRLTVLLERAKKENRELSLKISKYLNAGGEEKDPDFVVLLYEARHRQRDMVEDLERLFRTLSGYSVLETYRERYEKKLEEDDYGEP